MVQEAPLTITLDGLTDLDASELKTELKKAGIDLATLDLKKNVGAVGGARKGEPATIMAIIALSSIAMTAISIYLAKKRSHETREESITITLPDGTKFQHRIRTTGSAEEINADVMGKIAALKIPFPKTS
jgi:hypothetical protein